ncbi:MAG: hypothetical protein R3300_10655 [Candidatus Promineifilaceae bacterium]|nr:hypothetical protein [Candidatus Promineifilaceae bacterium]
MKRPLYYTGIVLISAATLVLELALLRLFAVQQFYHFAFMAISLALLGAGASGSLLSVRGRPFRPTLTSLLFAFTTAGAYLLINYLPFDSFAIAWDRRQILFLALYFLAAAAPFLFAGLLVGGELMGAGLRQAGVHQVYGANLIGSALGSLLSLPALATLDGPGALVLALILGALTTLCFVAVDWMPAERLRRQSATGLAAVVLILLGLVALWRPPDFLLQQLSPYKTLSILSDARGARRLVREWSATVRVDVIAAPTIHVMPGLSLAAPVDLPEQMGLLLDGDNLMPITGLGPDAEEAYILADYVPQGLAFRLRPQPETLILEAGTGLDVLLALARGAPAVTAVEENGLVLRVVRDDFSDFTGGLYGDSRVTLVEQSGRVFARRNSNDRFDLTVVSLTDPHRPVTSGAYSLTEDYRYTVQAFRDYLNTLEQDGLLVVNRWLQTPPSESARTFGALVMALEAGGFDPGEHLLAYRSLRTMTIIAARRPFTPVELDSAQTFFDERGYDAVYYPGVEPAVLNRHNVLAEPAYHDLFVRILTEPQATYADYRFDIRPPGDDRPFFFHFFKWRQTPEILATLGMTMQPFGGSGYFVLVALLVLVAVAAAILILGPLLWWQRSIAGTLPPIRFWRLRLLLYFAGLGLAFLFVEVPLAQQFILVLDQPVLALAVTLFSVLLFSGLGSLTVRRWRLTWALTLLVGLIALYPFLLDRVTGDLLAYPAWQRILLSIALVAPLGYLMGLPFAAGLTVVERYDPPRVPWVWAVNGTFSVISSVLAVMVALSAGFATVLYLGAAAYGVALLALGGLD